MEEIFKLLAENFIFPIWIKGLDGKFKYVNKKYAELYNNEITNFIGKTIEEAHEPKYWDMFNSHCSEVLYLNKEVSRELYSDTGYRQCTIFPIRDSGGNIVSLGGVIGSFSDRGKIKEKEYEVEFQKTLINQIMDTLPGYVFYKDSNSKYVYANKACREFYSEIGTDNILGKTDLEINPNKKQANKFIEDDKFILRTKEAIYNEVTFDKGDGSKMYTEIVKKPLTDTHGNITGIVGRSVDITEKKLIQKKLEYLSYMDSLTEVKNRACFEIRQEELNSEKYLPLGIIMGDANGLKLINDTFGHIEGDNLLKEIAKVMKNVCQNRGEVFRIGGDEFVILLPNSSKKECENKILEIVNNCKVEKNDLFNISISLGAALIEENNMNFYEVMKEAEDKVYRQKLLQNKSIKSSILNSLKIGLGVRSGETESHTNRVAVNAIKVGEMLKLELATIDELKIAADLHDIGKIGIGENILLKADKLSDKEYEIMKTHSEKGYRIIKASSELKSVAEAVLYHHERWDGTGYPLGLKEDGIPLLSRIISVCDSYDVMINDRVYKKAISKEDAITELKKCSGSQFDPKIVEVFLECIK